jgi:hypothetical protein
VAAESRAARPQARKDSGKIAIHVLNGWCGVHSVIHGHLFTSSKNAHLRTTRQPRRVYCTALALQR